VPIDQAAAAPGPPPAHGRTSPQRPAPRLPSATQGPAALGLDLSGLRLRVTAVGIPALARAAYVRAAASADAAKPSCGLTWQQLAAVGYVTSEHGSRGGRHLTAAGEAPTPLFAPLLDGHAGIEYADSDHGALDGSSRFDRGVGPFAIVPFVWRTWGADGNGDGVRDPQQIDDAALTAADFLCVATPTVRTGAGFHAALHTYDSDLGFAQTVADVARTYAGLPARTILPAPKAKHRKRAQPRVATAAVSGGFGTSP
ncbi:MAG TPA: hypothetical protein VHE83_01675, partial [Mycobacteriales bacterium]|nr:hypothetical protein [Mycobacteriales bacterium]